jgi:hypothetical protein
VYSPNVQFQTASRSLKGGTRIFEDRFRIMPIRKWYFALTFLHVLRNQSLHRAEGVPAHSWEGEELLIESICVLRLSTIFVFVREDLPLGSHITDKLHSHRPSAESSHSTIVPFRVVGNRPYPGTPTRTIKPQSMVEGEPGGGGCHGRRVHVCRSTTLAPWVISCTGCEMVQRYFWTKEERSSQREGLERFRGDADPLVQRLNLNQIYAV